MFDGHRNGIAVPEVPAGDTGSDSGGRTGRRPAGTASEPTVVFVTDDQMAPGVLRALAEEGVRAPGQIGILDFDDIPELEFFSPLTTITQNFGAAGTRRIAVHLEHTEAEGPHEREWHKVSPRLVARDSTAPRR
ncbi:substrate-binding domain-containing protein [Microbispora sp. RL4-1S]|uniref:Substrate-binding domain-containing protein n=1 Tax=Microbispora oryzae TaxID=2806554 RepID=A0A940WTA1_9ACTN|nr:substrate-binding domain-containing protein [Microbispora oryzae]MBP2706686.1 substrate-binding domain-containing protein [Microbispora oryzae]